MIVVDHHEDMGGRRPVCSVLDWIGTHKPIIKEVEKKKPMKISSEYEKGFYFRFILLQLTKRSYPNNRTGYVGHREIPNLKFKSTFVFSWETLDEDFLRNHNLN